MKEYYNNNDAYGLAGPFDANSPGELADGMAPTFRIWAEEAWDRIDETAGDGRACVDFDTFIVSAIAEMRSEFLDGLELVE